MTPAVILSAVRLGESALRAKHAALTALWKKFGASIRHTREARCMSRARLAKALGITTAMMGMLEGGKRSWRMARAEKAARLLARPEQWPDC